MYKSIIKEAISKWNRDNPELRQKTMASLANEIGISPAALSQLDLSGSFQKHAEVIMEPKVKFEQSAIFDLYLKLNIPIINRLQKIKEILGCEIYDLIKKM